MIVFIVPFISKQVCKDWKLATVLLQGTLDSIANQTDNRFQVVVSCHEIPEVSFKHDAEKLTFLPMSYSPLDDEWRGKSQTDRMMKCCTALLSLKDIDFKYCMAVDADDRIHRDLVKFLCEEPQTDGWIVDKGFQVDYSFRRVMRYSQLSKICGSTFILSKKLVGIPQAYTVDEYQKCIYCQGHQTMEQHFVNQDINLKAFPYDGVQYILNHGLNSSNEWRKDLKSSLKRIVKFYVFGGKLSEQDRKDFGYMEPIK
jgi:hypothetical protein